MVTNILKSKKKIIPIIIILLVVVIVLYINVKGPSTYIGEIEGVMYPNSTEVAGKIIECPIKLGSPIKKGDLIARIDDTNQKYVVEQLSLNMQKAQLASESSKVGKGGAADNNYSLAVANYESALVIEEKAKQDYNKAEKLYKESAISQDTFDNTKLAYDTAIKKSEAAKAQVNNSTDKTAGNVADIDVSILESQLNQQKEVLSKYDILAACDGVVMSKNYKEGDIVAVGYNIADISFEEEKYAVIYFPEDKIEQIKYNQKVLVDLGKNSVEGTIKYIDVKAQYTPKELQSVANRNQESLRVKILLPKDYDVNIGQKIKVKL